MSNTWKKRNELLAKAQTIQRLTTAELLTTWTDVKARFTAPADVVGMYQLMNVNAKPYISVRMSFEHGHADNAVVSLFNETKAHADDGQWMTSVKVNADKHELSILDQENEYLFTETLVDQIWQVVDTLIQLDDVHEQLKHMTIRNASQLFVDTELHAMIGKLNGALEKGMRAA